MAYGQCECLRWAWAPEMGPRSNDGHHPNCPEGMGVSVARVKLYERAFRAILRASYGEFRWGMPEAGRIAEEALEGKDTFLNMLGFQCELSRQRQRDELQAASKQELDKLAAVVNELVGDRAREREETIAFRRQILRGMGLSEGLIDVQCPLPEKDETREEND